LVAGSDAGIALRFSPLASENASALFLTGQKETFTAASEEAVTAKERKGTQRGSGEVESRKRNDRRSADAKICRFVFPSLRAPLRALRWISSFCSQRAHEKPRRNRKVAPG
jgi:hypothetical protein